MSPFERVMPVAGDALRISQTGKGRDEGQGGGWSGEADTEQAFKAALGDWA